MSDLFSADAPALGYLYQGRYALLVLLREGRSNSDLKVTVEGLDDVAFDDAGEPTELIQTKHHVDRKASLTDKSADLWKTLRVWAGRIQDGAIDIHRVALTLLTTATAPEGSAAAALRPEETGTRDEGAALTLLLEAARTSESKELTSAFRAFGDLGPAHQKLLLSAIRVLDSAPSIIDVEPKIFAELDLSVRPDHKQAFADRIEGWWFKRVVASLAGSEERAISYAALRAYISELRDRFTEDDLPADFPDPIELSEDELPETERLFIEQLRLIASRENRIRTAISDYWRAYQQRSRWVADGLLFDEDLERYENVLVDEWTRYFDDLLDQLADAEDDEEVKRQGRMFFHHIDTKVTKPIRPNFREDYVQRGTYHHLANGLRVGWHRDFIDRLEGIVGRASQRAT